MSPATVVATGAAPSHCVLVAECGRYAGLDVCALLAAAGIRPVELTIAAVAEPPHPLAAWAPMTGFETPERMRRMAVQEASATARDAVARVPADVPAGYRAAACWRDVAGWLLSGWCDVLIVAALPTRRRDRRLVNRLSAASRDQRAPSAWTPRRPEAKANPRHAAGLGP